MHVTCSQKDLSNHLSMVSRAVANRPTNPILANVLFSADATSAQLTLSAFDQTLCLQSRLSATVYEPGMITLPARTLGDLVSRLPEAVVELKISDTQATVRARLEREGKKDTLAGPYQIAGLPGEEFPALPEVTATAMPLEREAFLQGLRGVLFAASSDETKQILTGVHLQTRGETLEFAATDGHRLAIVETEVTSGGELVQATIPARALREVERLLAFNAYVVLNPGNAENLSYKQLLTEDQRMEIEDELYREDTHLSGVEIGFGAEAIKRLLQDLDKEQDGRRGLEIEAENLRQEIATAKGQRKPKLIKRLRVIDSFIATGGETGVDGLGRDPGDSAGIAPDGAVGRGGGLLPRI